MKRHLDDVPLAKEARTMTQTHHLVNQNVQPRISNVPSVLHLPAGLPTQSNPPNIMSQQATAQQANIHANPPLHASSNISTYPAGTVQYQYSSVPVSANPMIRHSPAVSPGGNFQRLKVEDALSYLDQVKYKFGNQPQVYNDFLDIMKEFKSQNIDTPGVIQRVSNLFKGHPELIVGFNTFLPPGYKIEVQSNEQGDAFQVSYSMPNSTTGTTSVIQTSHPSGQSETITLLPPQQTSNQRPSLTLVAAGAEAHHPTTPHTQPPVEFNHAINYVNKIKNRFQDQPDKYTKFLEILHTYQKQQRNIKEGITGPGKYLTEQEVYSQVSKLFEHQEDLLKEFGQFLPDATSHLNTTTLGVSDHQTIVKKSSLGSKPLTSITLPSYAPPGPEKETSRPSLMGSSNANKQSHTQLKRSASFSSSGIQKKHKSTSFKDITLADAAKYGSLKDYGFFDKVRKALKSQEVYENFLRCLNLFNQELLSRHELIPLVTPFLSRFPDLLKWFRDFLGISEIDGSPNRVDVDYVTCTSRQAESARMEIDFTSCKRLGASYCALPKSYLPPKCSGRTALCQEVLNDTWVSFPSWSEDSTFVTSRKTQYEEYIYRCEEERFELDLVIEINGTLLRVLDSIQKKMARMSPEEAAKHRLDDNLGSSTATVHLVALRRIYGDKAGDMLEGLKKNPVVAIPVVLRRLRAKEEEWRNAQKGFNKIWREQTEKYYLKSLDHQGVNFKQSDLKALRSKNLLNEIETIMDERNEQADDNNGETGPHLILPYKDKSILDDAANLLIHHVKRQSGFHKEDKHKMKLILRHFIPDIFHHARLEMSDDEMDVDSTDKAPAAGTSDDKTELEKSKTSKQTGEDKPETTIIKEEIEEKKPEPIHSPYPDEEYTLFMANNNWYMFLRLHQILCERLTKIYERANILAVEEAKAKLSNKESISMALHLKPKSDIAVEDYYPTFLDMIKNVLDGNIDGNAYEDSLREMFGIHAYIAYTLDKVVNYAVRQLQHIVCDEAPQECIDMFHQEEKRGATGGRAATTHQRVHQELAYQKRFEQAMRDENCFKIFIYKVDCKMTIEMLDNENEEPDTAADTEKWSNYVEKFTSDIHNKPSNELITLKDMPRPEKPILLPRCVRSWKHFAKNKADNARLKAEMEDKTEESSEGRDSPSRMGGPDEDALVIAMDNTECKFSLKNYKIQYVTHKENFLYNIGCLNRARQLQPIITKIKRDKFKRWNNRWAERHVTEDESKKCNDWYYGNGLDDL